jgi:hypothetical protein
MPNSLSDGKRNSHREKKYSHREYRGHRDIKVMSDKIINENCWVAYFDILGFKRKVQIAEKSQSNWILTEYKKVLKTAGYFREAVNNNVVWFSDSFIFYSDNSAESIAVAAQWFFDFMFWEKIALRGCLNYGRLYADQVARIYYGTALIEAYQLAESQDWIGFVLSEEAKKKMRECRAQNNETCWDASKSHYMEYDVPLTDRGIADKKRKLPAYKIGYRPESIDPDLYLRFVQMWEYSRYDIDNDSDLSEEQRKKELVKVRRKYENTDQFLSRAYPQIDQNLRNLFLNSQ